MNMDIKILRLLGAIGVFLSMVSSTCKCGTGCAEIKYSFNINCKAYPDKDSINVGDTIWIEIKAPHNCMMKYPVSKSITVRH